MSTSTPATAPKHHIPGWCLLLLASFSAAACGADRGTIGALLAQSPDRRLAIREVPRGLAAEHAGVQPGDEILLIDGRDVRGMSAEQVHRALGGEVGEAVKLTLIRGDRVVRVTLRLTPARRASRSDPASEGGP